MSPYWGTWVQRWGFFQAIVGVYLQPLYQVLQGTILLNALFRMLGAKIGKRVFLLNSRGFTEPDLVCYLTLLKIKLINKRGRPNTRKNQIDRFVSQIIQDRCLNCLMFQTIELYQLIGYRCFSLLLFHMYHSQFDFFYFVHTH